MEEVPRRDHQEEAASKPAVAWAAADAPASTADDRLVEIVP
jgi:hypothetical protein